MKRIPLHGTHGVGLFALVDDADYPLVSGYRWIGCRSSHGRIYASTYANGRQVLMHNLLMDVPEGMQVDHVEDPPLDCRRANLRLSTPSQNLRNSPSRGGTSRFKGVSSSRPGRFVARIRLGGQNIYLGIHDTEEEAARAYDEVTREHFGAFGRYNFPRPGERSALREPSGDGQSSALPSLSPPPSTGAAART
jgi:hypothetical protein